MKANAPLAKLDIASVYGTEGQRFESPTARHKTQYIVVFIEKCFAIYCVLFFVFGDFRERNFKNKPLCLLLHRFCVSTLAGRYCKLRAVHIFTISSLMPHAFACVVNVCLNSFCVSPFIDKIPSYTICTIFPFFAFYPILIGKQFWKHRKSRENCRPFLPAFYRSFSLLIAAIISGKIKYPPTLAGISMFFSQL